MKVAAVALLGFMCSISLGQYTPIVQEDSISWFLKNEIPDGAIFGELWVGDTTVIDSTFYHEIYYSWIGLSGYFREDTVSGRVWFRGVSDSMEWLIMDLSLATGDTFIVRMPGSWSHSGKDSVYTTVKEVDTVQGRKEVTLELMYGGGFIDEHLTFIEGIGPNASLIYAISPDVFPDYGGGLLVCKAYRDSSLVYAWNTTDPEDCGPFEGINGGNFFWGKIYPNPFTAFVTISLDIHAPVTVVIYDLLGRALIQSHFIGNINLDLSEVEDRVLIYRIMAEGFPTATGTLINLPEH